MIATRLTIDDFERLTDAEAHNKELVEGELVDVPGNIGEHVCLKDGLAWEMGPFVRQRRLGRVMTKQEFQFGRNAHGPDIAFIGPEKMPLFDRKRRVQLFVPDLAIEIASNRDTFGAMIKKARRYRDSGTKEVWVFTIPELTAFVLSTSRQSIIDETGTFAPEQIPGFSMSMQDLFALAAA